MTRRVQKVAKLLKQQISVLIKKEINEEYGIITVTAIDVTPDLKEAKVYISCFDKNYEKEISRDLGNSVLEFQHVLGKKLQMKFTPRLIFIADQSLATIDRVEEILEEVRKP